MSHWGAERTPPTKPIFPISLPVNSAAARAKDALSPAGAPTGVSAFAVSLSSQPTSSDSRRPSGRWQPRVQRFLGGRIIKTPPTPQSLEHASLPWRSTTPPPPAAAAASAGLGLGLAKPLLVPCSRQTHARTMLGGAYLPPGKCAAPRRGGAEGRDTTSGSPDAPPSPFPNLPGASSVLKKNQKRFRLGLAFEPPQRPVGRGGGGSCPELIKPR